MLNNQQWAYVRNRAKTEGIDPAGMQAFVQVESNGQVYASVPFSRTAAVIRFEGHYFDKLVPPALRAKARKLGLASPSVGGVKNPTTQAGRYALLDRAKALHYDAAVASTSYGLGQVMGDNWQLLGSHLSVNSNHGPERLRRTDRTYVPLR